MRRFCSGIVIAFLLACLSVLAQTGMVLPAGTGIHVRTDRTVSATAQNVGRLVPATVSQDVKDSEGRVLVPHGSRAQLVIAKVPK